MAGRPSPDPETFLPLSPAVLAILVALAGTPQHGYGIIAAVREMSGGRRHLGTGPLYRHLRRLLDDGLVEPVARVEETDERRRYYRPTPLGRSVLAAETARLGQVLSRARRVVSPARGRS